MVRITDQFDARFGIRFGRFTIDDFHGKHRVLSVPEIYKYSSNIGTIRVMQAMGKDTFRAFLTRIGFDKRVPFELPEMRSPEVPEKFSEIVAATASFGHGLSVSPLHQAVAYAAFVNDGCMLPPTLYKRTEAEARALCTQVISPQTSALHPLPDAPQRARGLGLADEQGSRRLPRRRQDRHGREGGRRPLRRRALNLNVFSSAFPLDDPRYAMVIIVDEPHAENEQSGTTAGWNAGEVTGRIIAARRADAWHRARISAK